MAGYLRVRRIDDDGIALVVTGDRPVDVCIGSRRIWTFWTLRDTEGSGPVRRAPWPHPLRKHLHGRSRIEVLDSATSRSHFDAEVTLGDGTGEIEVRSEQGVELGIDKSGRLVSTFGDRSDADIDALLDATEAVIAALRETGLEPFLAYGTLLGAVREGRVLGHDSDADLGYVSHFTDPVDVCRESFRVQRELNARGWVTWRYSGAAFKIDVTEGDVTRGLDVFGGFFSGPGDGPDDGGRLYLLGEVGVDYERDWVWPLTTCDLSGRPMPVPARPEKLLEASYGAGWQVPDPAFKFTTPRRTVRALDEWFRGNQPNVRLWERRANGQSGKPLREPSAAAKLVAKEAVARGAEVLDIGAGRGSDALWLARQGLAVTAYDFVPRALRDAERAGERDGVSFETRFLNLTDLRSTYGEGARLAHSARPRVVLARHVLDATSGIGRASLARLCSMALREGGLLVADLHVDGEGADEADPVDWMVGLPTVEAVTRLLTRAGATRVEVSELTGRARPTVRLEGEW